MIYCIIGRNGVCNNDFSSGCYKCHMALCYDDSREVMGLQECVFQAMELISALQKESVSPAVFFETARFIFFGYPFVVTARTGMQAEGSLHRKQLCLFDRQLSVFSMGGKTGDMAGAKTVCCLSVTLGILSENIVQQLEKAISDIAGIAGIPFTDAVINQYHNF